MINKTFSNLNASPTLLQEFFLFQLLNILFLKDNSRIVFCLVFNNTQRKSINGFYNQHLLLGWDNIYVQINEDLFTFLSILYLDSDEFSIQNVVVRPTNL